MMNSCIIKAGIGYSVLPDYLCKEGIAKGELVALGKPGPENDVYLVWKKGALRHPRVDFAKDVIMRATHLDKASPIVPSLHNQGLLVFAEY